MSKQEYAAPQALSWRIDLPHNGEGLTLVRSELVDIVQETSEFVVDSLVRHHNLGESVREAIYQRVADSYVYFTNGVFLQDKQSPTESYPISEAISDNVTDLCSEKKDDDSSDSELQRRDKVYLSAIDVEEEIGALSSASHNVQRMHEGNEEWSNQATKDVFESMQEKEALLKVAISIACARRLLKYCIVKDEDIPLGMREWLGFEEWAQSFIDSQQGQSSLDNFELENIKSQLAHYYNKEDWAAKNLRHTLWTPVFQDLLSMDIQSNPLFFAFYKKEIENASNSVTFSYEGFATALGPHDTGQAMTCIYAPSSVGLRTIK